MTLCMTIKPVKRGYKIWCLADSRTGFVSQFDIYSERSDRQVDSSFYLVDSVDPV